MNDLQSKLYTMLVEIDEICKKHDIVYYLAAGGSLGAVRNGGFLPWDDDLDLYITRENWEKFRSVIWDEIPENRTFCCEEEIEDYLNPIGRYVDKDSTMMMYSQMMIGECCGEFVEFFIFDYLPADPEAAWEQRKNMKVFTELMTPYFIINPQLLKSNADFDYDLFMNYYHRALNEGFTPVLAELKEKVTSCREEDADSYCMRWGFITYIFPKESFGEPRYIDFEGRKFPVVNQVERVLRLSYGDDWMCVPQGEGKVTHDLSQDIFTPYETFTDIYMPLLDKPALRQAYRESKDAKVKSVPSRTQYQNEFVKAKLDLAERKIKKRFYDVEGMYKLLGEGKIDELGEQLAYFNRVQGEIDIKQHNALIDLCDEYYDIAVRQLIAKGQFHRGNKILKLVEARDKELIPALAECREMIDVAHNLSVAIYDNKSVEEVDSILEANSKFEGELIDYEYAKLWSMKNKAETTEDYQNLLNVSNVALEKFYNTGELLGLKAFALHKLGDDEQSKSVYETACNRTRNAFVWAEANSIFSEIDKYADMR